MKRPAFQPTFPFAAAARARLQRPLSLRRLLILMTLTAVLPLLAVEFIDSEREQRERLIAAGDSVDALAAAVATSHVQLIEGVGQVLAAVAAAPGVGSPDPSACVAYLQAVQSVHETYVNFGLADANGQLLCDASGTPPGLSLADRDYFQRAIAAGGALIAGEHLISRLSTRHVIVFARRVHAQVGPTRQQLVAYAAVGVDRLGRSLRLHAGPPEATVHLTDAAGVVLAGRGPEVDPAGTLLTDPVLRAAVRSHHGGPVSGVEDDGRLRAVRPVRVGGQDMVYAVVALPAEHVVAPALASLQRRMAGVLLVAGAVAALVWLVGHRLLSQPLGRLVDGLQQIERGDYTQAMSPERAMVREIAALEHSLGSLVMALETQRFERDQALGALTEREARYRELFEANPQVMYVFEIRTLSFLAVNDAAVAFYGYSRDEFQDMTLLDIRPPAERGTPGLPLAPAPDLRTPQVWTHRLKNGELRQVEASHHATVFDGHPAQLVMVTDVTARLAAEARARQATEQLEQRVAERTRDLELSNRELEAFAWSVSHDLRNPLRAVAMFCQMLADHLAAAPDAEAALYLQRMEQGLTSMERLIDELMTLARVARVQLNRVRVDLGELAREVVAGLRAQHPLRQVTVEIADHLVCTGDAALLRQVMANLIGNAWKFTARTPAPCIRVGRLPPVAGSPPVFFVTDNGAGFDMKFADKLFEPFERLHADEDFQGTGIGLATVQRVLARHGGRIRAEAAVGRGATFYFVVNPRDTD